MTVPVPTEAVAVAAVRAAIDAVNPALGTVLDSRSNFDSELRFIEGYKQSDHSLDLWVVFSETLPEIEGDATGEAYPIYRIVCEYYNIILSTKTWDKLARALVKTIHDALNGNASIFRIGGQVQLFTPETAIVESQGFELVEGEQYVFKARISLQVEARRWE